MRLVVDATSLLTPRTGIGVFTFEVLRALATRPDMQVSAFNTSRAHRQGLTTLVAAFDATAQLAASHRDRSSLDCHESLG